VGDGLYDYELQVLSGRPGDGFVGVCIEIGCENREPEACEYRRVRLLADPEKIAGVRRSGGTTSTCPRL
jgi:hypothetical protein